MDRQSFANTIEDYFKEKSSNDPIVRFVKSFNEDVSKKQWCLTSAQWTLGLSVLYALLKGEKRFGYRIYYYDQINMSNLFDAYNDWARFDINNEIPILFSTVTDFSDQAFLLTNKKMYLKGAKGGSVFTLKETVAEIELSHITEMCASSKLSGFAVLLSINGEDICTFNFEVRNDNKVVKDFFNRLGSQISTGTLKQ